MKKVNSTVNYKIFFFIALIVIAVLGYKVYSDNTLTYEECLKLGSNERTAICLQELERRNPQPAEPTIEDLSVIEVADPVMDNSRGLNPYFTATLRNNGAVGLKNITFRFKFF